MSVTINGRTYPGNNLSMKNNKIFIDGKEIKDIEKKETEKEILFVIEGNIEGDLEVERGNVEIKGDVKNCVKVDTGNVTIKGNISGNVSVDCGNISAKKIEGTAKTDCGNISKGFFA